MQSTSKRKMIEEGNPLIAAAKRVKKEQTKSTVSNKRKLLLNNGQELPGGLVIVRAPSAQGQRHPSSPSPPPSQSLPPSKKFRADDSSLDHDRGTHAVVRGEPEVDEDVRRMDSEANDLRRYSRESMFSPGGSALTPQFAFPATLSQQKEKEKQKQKKPVKVIQGSSDGFSARESLHQRRSSMGLRGKRISSSFAATGVIALPHNSVSDSSFFKHIDADLPPAARVRQLLIWSSSRAIANAAREASTAKKPKGKKSTKDKQFEQGPQLSEKAAQVLRAAQDQVIKMMAERKVDTGVFGGPGGSQENFKENAQNVRNRQCKARFTTQIDRAQAEELAWAETDRFYAARLAEMAEMAEPEQPEQPESTSSKAKGKRRMEEPESEALPRIDELPAQFRGGTKLALKVLEEGLGEPTQLAQQFERLRFQLDDLHAFANTALRFTNVAESELDFRFALLSLSLARRSVPHATTRSLAVANLLSSTQTRDPQELLRALAHVDAQRPLAFVGDSARRAVREVQRVNETGGGAGERRLTGVSPPVLTPRKPPGTPRRTTPAPNR